MEDKDMSKNGGQFNGQDANTTIDINADENMRGTSHLNDPLEDSDEVEKFKLDIEEQKDKYLRLLAEFENVKRRNAKERMELIQTAGKEVIVSMLDVLDDCDRAEKQIQSTNDLDQVKEGVQLVFNKLRSIMQNKGLKPMESKGSDFDVEKHEAITEIPAPSNALVGKVVDEVTKGYYLNDKIIRHAKVIVGK